MWGREKSCQEAKPNSFSMSNRHLRFNASKRKHLDHWPPGNKAIKALFLPTFPISVNSTSIHPDVQAPKLKGHSGLHPLPDRLHPKSRVRIHSPPHPLPRLGSRFPRSPWSGTPASSQLPCLTSAPYSPSSAQQPGLGEHKSVTLCLARIPQGLPSPPGPLTRTRSRSLVQEE